VTAPARGRAADRRFLHDDEAASLKMLHKPLGDDPRHHLGGIVLPFPAIKAQRERQGVGDVIRGGLFPTTNFLSHIQGARASSDTLTSPLLFSSSIVPYDKKPRRHSS